MAGNPIRLVIHGGAGAIKRSKRTEEREAAYRRVLAQSLTAGYAVLEGGGSSIDAVIAAIVVMEDSPLFNAGKGSVFSHAGRNELEASVMDGSTRMAGAVAGVTTIRNPIRAAHAVMTKSAHVMLMGQGAEIFAAEQGLELVDPSYFHTPYRWNQLQKAIAKESVLRDHDVDGDRSLLDKDVDKDEKRGTVGAVALDRYGNVAAGTSTGGLTNKRFGRVGIRQSSAQETMPTIARLRYRPPAPEKCSSAPQPLSTPQPRCDCKTDQLLKPPITR